MQRNGFSHYLHAYFASPSADADDVSPQTLHRNIRPLALEIDFRWEVFTVICSKGLCISQ
jgi:hypothetical protein